MYEVELGEMVVDADGLVPMFADPSAPPALPPDPLVTTAIKRVNYADPKILVRPLSSTSGGVTVNAPTSSTLGPAPVAMTEPKPSPSPLLIVGAALGVLAIGVVVYKATRRRRR